MFLFIENVRKTDSFMVTEADSDPLRGKGWWENGREQLLGLTATDLDCSRKFMGKYIFKMRRVVHFIEMQLCTEIIPQ